MEEATSEINRDQRTTRTIYNAFDLCGLNPWKKDLSKLKEHLDSLERNAMYSALLDKRKAIDLKKITFSNN